MAARGKEDSGSGKSSLAFDTIYAEGQRRYVESLSAYARQFLEQMADDARVRQTRLPAIPETRGHQRGQVPALRAANADRR